MSEQTYTLTREQLREWLGEALRYVLDGSEDYEGDDWEHAIDQAVAKTVAELDEAARDPMPKGYTWKPEILDIMREFTPYRRVAVGDDFHTFSKMTAAAARALLDLLPKEHAEHRHNESPSFAEMVALAEAFPGTLLSGHHVGPRRDDERITFTTIYFPAKHAKEAKAKIKALPEVSQPDEWELTTVDERRYRRAWWD